MANTEMDYMNIGMGNVIGVNVDNIVHEFIKDSDDTSTTSDTSTWVATEDCILAGFISYNPVMGGNPAIVSLISNSTIYLSRAYSVFVPSGSSSNTFVHASSSIFCPIKKGQTIQIRTATGFLSYVNAYKPLY